MSKGGGGKGATRGGRVTTRSASAGEQAAYNAWYDSLSAEERTALKAYAGELYEPLNVALRAGNMRGHEGLVRSLDSALAKAPGHGEVTAYRHIGLDSLETLRGMPSFQDGGYGSVSLRADAIGSTTAPVRVKVRSSAPGMWLGDNGMFRIAQVAAGNRPALGIRGEAEFLIGRGRTWTWKSDSAGSYLEVR